MTYVAEEVSEKTPPLQKEVMRGICFSDNDDVQVILLHNTSTTLLDKACSLA